MHFYCLIINRSNFCSKHNWTEKKKVHTFVWSLLCAVASARHQRYLNSGIKIKWAYMHLPEFRCSLVNPVRNTHFGLNITLTPSKQLRLGWIILLVRPNFCDCFPFQSNDYYNLFYFISFVIGWLCVHYFCFWRTSKYPRLTQQWKGHNASEQSEKSFVFLNAWKGFQY